MATGSQYLGLGYANGGTINSHFSASAFNVINFALPSSFAVTSVGATPVVVVVNSSTPTSGFNVSGVNLSSKALALFLDGTNSYTNQALGTNPSATGSPVSTIIREPLSGTYKTMEYNVPNTTVLKTSQDVGLNQPVAQKDCSGAAAGPNPMFIATPSGGVRERAIGTGQELSEVIATTNSLGYGFWSVGNFKGFTSAAAPNARYPTVDNIDPLLNSYAGGTVPTTSAQIANVTLANVANGTYPIWSVRSR